MKGVYAEDGDDSSGEAILTFEVTLPRGRLAWMAYGVRIRIDGRPWQRLRRGRSIQRVTAGPHEIDVQQRRGRYIVERTQLRVLTVDRRPVTIEVNVATGSVQTVERPI